jgi:hypothetical protein
MPPRAALCPAPSRASPSSPQHPVEVMDLVTTIGVGLYLVEELLPNSLDLGLLHIKGGANLGEAFLADYRSGLPPSA